MKKFIIIGVAGFVAKRHLQAIKHNSGELIASHDINDSVGIIDSYFPESKFFNDISRFERFIDEFKRNKGSIDYLVICSPNYLHDFHIKLGLRHGMDVICEKPLVINPNLLSGLFEYEKKFDKNIYCLLQLRLKKNVQKMKNLLKNKGLKEININYVTPRGSWYDYSWKSDEEKSGGILINIGIHLFDFLTEVLGNAKDFKIIKYNNRESNGVLYFDNLKVNFNLSLNSKKFETKREIIIGAENINIDQNFSNNHSECYKQILNNNKTFLAKNCSKSIFLVNKMRISIGAINN
ncbi:MAG: oxidoreductase [Rickettsiales bacterium]|nr:oxidoreductase [Rickettsiales bacterium]